MLIDRYLPTFDETYIYEASPDRDDGRRGAADVPSLLADHRCRRWHRDATRRATDSDRGGAPR